MIRLIAAMLLALLLIVLAGCESGSGEAEIPLGGALIEVVGNTARFRARVGFTNQAGNPVAPPAGGAMVAIGGPEVVTAGDAVRPAQGDTVVARVAGTDNAGTIDIEIVGLSLQSTVPLRVGAEGFLPLYVFFPPGRISMPAGTLILRQDPDPADNPQIQNPGLLRGQDGILRLRGIVPDKTDLIIFLTPGIVTDVGELNSFDGVDGTTLDTQTTPIGQGMSLFTTDLPTTLPTGRLFICASEWDRGFGVKTYGTCGLSLVNYIRGGRVVRGTINGPGGGAAGGAEIIVFEEGNGSNSGSTTAAGNGNFSASMSTGAPTGNNVTVQAQWTDPATGITWVCAWSGLP